MNKASQLHRRALVDQLVSNVREAVLRGDIKVMGKTLRSHPCLLEDGTVVHVDMNWPITFDEMRELAERKAQDDE